MSATEIADAIKRPRNKISTLLNDGLRDGKYDLRQEGTSRKFALLPRNITGNKPIATGTGGVFVTPTVPIGVTEQKERCARCHRDTPEPFMGNDGSLLCISCFDEEKE